MNNKNRALLIVPGRIRIGTFILYFLLLFVAKYNQKWKKDIENDGRLSPAAVFAAMIL